MKAYLLLLLAFLFPFAEPGEQETADDTSDAGTDDADDTALDASSDDADDASDDADTAVEEEETAAPASRASRTAARTDRADEAIRLAREAQEAVARLTPAPRNAQFEEEERKLRDPETSELEKWQIQSNRALRDSQQQSRQALFQAQDMADRTSYQAKAISNPLFSKYEKKVEALLAEARSKGANPNREFCLQLAIGKAILDGNFKAKADAPKKTIARGKSPGARSDTAGRGGMTDHQKRAARLANTQI